MIRTDSTFKFPRRYLDLLKKLAENNVSDEYTSDRKAKRAWLVTWAKKITTRRRWESKAKENAVSAWIPLYISPCGQFLIKLGYMGRDARIPAEHLIPTVYATTPEEDTYVWTLQPIADITYDSRQTAYRYFQGLEVDGECFDDVYDAHDGNVAIWNGKPVLIDW